MADRFFHTPCTLAVKGSCEDDSSKLQDSLKELEAKDERIKELEKEAENLKTSNDSLIRIMDNQTTMNNEVREFEREEINRLCAELNNAKAELKKECEMHKAVELAQTVKSRRIIEVVRELTLIKEQMKNDQEHFSREENSMIEELLKRDNEIEQLKDEIERLKQDKADQDTLLMEESSLDGSEGVEEVENDDVKEAEELKKPEETDEKFYLLQDCPKLLDAIGADKVHLLNFSTSDCSAAINRKEILLFVHNSSLDSDSGFSKKKYEHILALIKRWKMHRRGGEVHVIGWNYKGQKEFFPSEEMDAFFDSYDSFCLENEVQAEDLAKYVQCAWPDQQLSRLH